MNKEDLSSHKNTNTFEYFSREISKFFKGAHIKSKKLKKGFFEVKIVSGRIEVSLDVDAITSGREDAYLGHLIGHIESLRSLGKVKASGKQQAQLGIFFKNFSNGYYKFFYNFIYRHIGVYRTHISPVDKNRLQRVIDSQVTKLESKYSPIPQHIQFLLAISGKDIPDTEVKSIVGGLKNNSILSQLIDPRISEASRLSLIHTYILPQYEYFLSHDKKNWKNTKTKKDTIEDIIEKTKSSTEKVQEPSESQEKKEGIPGEKPDNDESSGNYDNTYSTPEGGSFEKGGKKNQGIEIAPGLQGYFVMDQKSVFDSATLKWTNISPQSKSITPSSFTGKKYSLKAQFSSPGLKALPTPYGYAIDTTTSQIQGSGGMILRDSLGNFFFENYGKSEIEGEFAKIDNFQETPPQQEDTQILFSQSLSQKAMSVLAAAKQETDIRESVRMIRDYITSTHFYPPGKNEKETNNLAVKLQKHLQDISTGADYFFHLDNSSHLECYSANSLFVAMLRHIGIAARLATGHHVQSLAKNGNSYLSSSNGHGWTMLWDGSNWIRFDATPEKDPHDPRNKKDPKEKNEDDDQEENQGGESADDGGEYTPGNNKGEGEEGEGKGESTDGKSDNGKSESKGKKGKSAHSEEKTDYGEVIPEKNEDNFESMYKELSEGEKDSPEQQQDRDDSPESFQENQQEAEAFEELVNAQAEAIEKEEQPEKKEDQDEKILRRKYPKLSDAEIQRLARFMKEFRKDLQKISELENPLFKEGKSEYRTLEEALRSIFDRVVSRRIKEREIPRYPVIEGDFLIDPVQLYMDEVHGNPESYSFQTTQIEREEELKIVKVRKRKVLDASGSMDSGKLRTQQMIEVLENKVTAEKQIELNEISERLSRDLKLETETWQFGTRRSSSARFTLLKALGSEFSETEQSAIWNLAAVAEGGTNDFDPLEAIYESLQKEQQREKREKPYELSSLERMRMGFLIREIESYKKLEVKQEKTPHEEIHYKNLSQRDTKKVKQNIARFVPQNNNIIDTSMLSEDEQVFLKQLSFEGKSTVEIFEEWLELLKSRDAEMEPILDIIEISSDGGSDDSQRLQEVVSKLRSLGVIVISYGLGTDGKAVEQVYKNTFNPDEGGNYCRNLLDYPRLKMESWKAILETI